MICPSKGDACVMEVKQTIEDARSHVRWHHPKLTDESKIILRDKICKFVPSEGIKTRGRTKEENFLANQCGIK